MWPAFKLLAKFKGLRGTALDLFGHTAERKMERALIRDYEALIARSALRTCRQKNHPAAVEAGELPEQIRGFGHVKERNVAAVARGARAGCCSNSAMAPASGWLR